MQAGQSPSRRTLTTPSCTTNLSPDLHVLRSRTAFNALTKIREIPSISLSNITVTMAFLFVKPTIWYGLGAEAGIPETALIYHTTRECNQVNQRNVASDTEFNRFRYWSQQRSPSSSIVSMHRIHGNRKPTLRTDRLTTLGLITSPVSLLQVSGLLEFPKHASLSLSLRTAV
ncbi:hypothetical protein GQ43DRAFT_61114 [Delitschia confertaspora ATCC 74209]|uniref:Uncharacterized protein n=1 Tax=Delitschia confertaspora ATCC 74209 TaxID=1513339 RepID=A0A9P4MYC8_9PLEO|nr:hypothetical protein GQ43DRAFT_61114 [Delitschia confertaspora ATCC 74209]